MTPDPDNQTNPIRPWTDRERESMQRSLDEIGVASPVIKAPSGETVEGHHREELYRDRGLEAPVFVAEHLTTPELVAKARILLNTSGRLLTWGERESYIAALLVANPDQSDRQVAQATGASPTSVGKVRRKLEKKGDVSTVDTRTDSKGRKQPARKPEKLVRSAAQPTPTAPVHDGQLEEEDEAKQTLAALYDITFSDVDSGMTYVEDDDLTSLAHSPACGEAIELLTAVRDWVEAALEILAPSPGINEEVKALYDKIVSSAIPAAPVPKKKPTTKRAPADTCGDCRRSANKVALENGVCVDAKSCERSQKIMRTKAARLAGDAEEEGESDA